MWDTGELKDTLSRCANKKLLDINAPLDVLELSVSCDSA